MASTYTGLGVQLMTTGEKAGLWGGLTNTNWNIIEQISGGYLSQAITSTPTTLAVADGTSGNTNQVAHRVIEFTGSIGENTIVTIPLDVQQLYVLKNSSSGAYTVQFKYVTGSGGSVTWGTTDKGTKIVYATANDGTNPDIIDATADFATAASTTTFTNKTLTAPKFADGGFIADAGGDETLVFGEVSTPVNELKITNAATGSGPIISSVSTSSTDTNIDINVTPAGTGNVNLSADAVQVGDNNADATITTQGTGDLILNTNAGTNSGNITIADGANGDITITPDGTGVAKAVDGADATGAIKIAGKETMWVPATAMYATTTNGAEAAQAELTATQPELKTLAFDTTTAEYAQFNVCFPKSWDEGVVQFQTYWSASATDTGTGGFKLQGVSIASDVDYDTAYGTAVANTALAASGTQDDLMVNVVSGDVTIASAAVDTNTSFQIVRNVAVDTNTGDLRLVGVKIFYTTDAANDA